MTHQPQLRRLGRARVLLAAVLVTLPLLVVPAAAQPSKIDGGKIEHSLAVELDSSGSADFYVEFAERADLSAASAIADWD